MSEMEWTLWRPWLPWALLVLAVLGLMAGWARALRRGKAPEAAPRQAEIGTAAFAAEVVAGAPLWLVECDTQPPFAIRRMAGRSPQDVAVGATLAGLVPPEDLAALANPPAAGGAATAPEASLSLRLTRPGGAPSLWACHARYRPGPPSTWLLALLPAPQQGAAALRLERMQQLIEQQGMTQRLLEDLQQITDRLQFCDDAAQAYEVVGEACTRLFPGWDGHLAVMRANQVMETAVHWGSGAAPPSYPADACWAVKRGKLHVVAGPGLKPMCTHGAAPPPDGVQTLCAPLMLSDKGILGVIHLRRGSANEASTVGDAEMSALSWRATTLADGVTLSLFNMQVRESLRDQAVRDGMTGLFNRREFDAVMLRESSRAARSGDPLTLAIFDIDHFKSFNDTFGHEAGDEVIRAVAAQLERFGRSYDIPCRVGGEELAVLMPRTHAEEALARLEALREAIGVMQVTFEARLLPPVTVSVGVADTATGGEDDLFRRADAALYAAKHGGRNQIQRWQDRGAAPAPAQSPRPKPLPVAGGVE